MVYRSDKPPQSKDDKNRRERERYGGIADLIMQIRQELGISVKFHAPILVNCLETITRLQEENAKLDMDIAAARKLQRDRQQLGIDASGPFGHGSRPTNHGVLPGSLPLIQPNQFLALQNAVGPKALPPVPMTQGAGFSITGQQQQPIQIVSSPGSSPGYAERREGDGGQGQLQNNVKQSPSNPILFASSFTLPGGQTPALPAHGSAQPSTNRPRPLSPDYLPQTREEMAMTQASCNQQQQSQAVHPGPEGPFLDIIQQQLGQNIEYGAQVQQSVPGKMVHQNMAMRQRTSPYQNHPHPVKQSQYHGQQQNMYQINQESAVFLSPGQHNHHSAANGNGNNNMAMQQQRQQQPVEMESNIHQTRDLPPDSRPPSSASEGFFSSFEDSSNQSMFSELNNTQPSDLGHSETFEEEDYSIEQI